MPIYTIIFYSFALLLLASAAMVISSRNTVHSLLYLVVAFFASAALWMLLQAEFLSLVLIFLYVGAVMTLFLFVVMMLNLDMSLVRENLVTYLPVALITIMVLVGLMVVVINPMHLRFADRALTHYPATYNNTRLMGTLMFTQYLYPFEIAAAILLVAIVSAIALAFHGRKPNTKSQRMAQQHAAKKASRLKIIKMKSEKS